jgi:phosphatidylglycerol:prolipoprotein diacylglycerol transferase
MIGARLGYVFFYSPLYYWEHPFEVLEIWKGGMSFHGGALGVIIASLNFCKRKRYEFYTLADPSMPFVAVGVGIVRIANFINSELYGSPTNLPWAVIFYDRDYNYTQPSHPSQIYESFCEGFFMAILLQYLLFKTKIKGLIFWLFIGLYGVVRYLIEFIRLPDYHIRLYRLEIYQNNEWMFTFFSIGQILCLVMVVIAVGGCIRILRRGKSPVSSNTKNTNETQRSLRKENTEKG